MKKGKLITVTTVAALTLAGLPVVAQVVYTKAIVAERIRQVENGVDQFRNYLERRGDDAKDRAEAAEPNERTGRRGTTSSSEARKGGAENTKDALADALGDLNRATNRLRRKFDPTDKWIETKVQLEQVMDEARDVNKIMTRGHYGTQAERYWGTLRKSINDLAICYGLAPMGV